MATFATELAERIRSRPAFRSDLNALQAAGVRASMPDAPFAEVNGPTLDQVGRLLQSASVFAEAPDDASHLLAQRIAIFASLVSNDDLVNEAVTRVLAGLGNFPAIALLEQRRDLELGLQSHLHRHLLALVNTVETTRGEFALTDYQWEVWSALAANAAVAISAPTSAGKSFLVLEHLLSVCAERDDFLGIYVAPTRALLAEVHSKIEGRLLRQGGAVRVTTVPAPDPLQRTKQIYVLTQERLQMLLASIDARRVDMLVVDEAQSLGEDSRGMILQDCLEVLGAKFQLDRLVFLAPGVSGFEQLREFRGAEGLRVASTLTSPVVQNRIVVTPSLSDEHELRLDLLEEGERYPVGRVVSRRGFALEAENRLAAVALELGAGGRSLVYAPGPASAEKVARQLANELPESAHEALVELSAFIKKNIHSKYSLASHIRRGVAFHYGNMPSVLREGIEGAFRDGTLTFLACTTTLFQGVNLPARNVFIAQPTRGRGEPLDEAALWNFAGRAGRLDQETVGNVFLLDYESWERHPFDRRKEAKLRLAFDSSLRDEYHGIRAVLEGAIQGSRDVDGGTETAQAAAGLAMLRATEGTLEASLQRFQSVLPEESTSQLVHAVERARAALELPPEVLRSSWTVSLVGLASLLKRLREKIAKGDAESLLPVLPTTGSWNVYKGIFFSIYKHLGGFKLSGADGKRAGGFVNHVGLSALKWMQGQPLAVLIANQIAFDKKQNPKKPEQRLVDASVKKTFDTVEKEIRFNLVRWGRAYVALLRFALREANLGDLAEKIYDFPLALELGVSSQTGRSLVELGLSRMSACAVAGIVPNSALSVGEVREWFAGKSEEAFDLSPLILSELKAKGLIVAA